MSTEEVESYPYIEYLDLLSCLAIYEGVAKEKKKPRKMSFLEFLSLE